MCIVYRQASINVVMNDTEQSARTGVNSVSIAKPLNWFGSKQAQRGQALRRHFKAGCAKDLFDSQQGVQCTKVSRVIQACNDVMHNTEQQPALESGLLSAIKPLYCVGPPTPQKKCTGDNPKEVYVYNYLQHIIKHGWWGWWGGGGGGGGGACVVYRQACNDVMYENHPVPPRSSTQPTIWHAFWDQHSANNLTCLSFTGPTVGLNTLALCEVYKNSASLIQH